jgi:hypothetical protein
LQTKAASNLLCLTSRKICKTFMRLIPVISKNVENFNERKNMKEKPLNFFPTFKASLLDIKDGMTMYGKIVFVKSEREQIKSSHNHYRIY